MNNRTETPSSRLEKPVAMFPKNHWYVAARSKEVGRELLARKILGKDLVLYRCESGEPVALSGLCPHRQFPLGKGTLFGDELECRYHGITFGPSGECLRIPTQESIPASCRLTNYPLVEKWEWLWIWVGEPELADSTAIPDMNDLRLGEEGWRAMDNGTFRFESRIQLSIDNLMDLSHVYALHFPAGLMRDIPPPKVHSELHNNRWTVTTETPVPADEFTKTLFPDCGDVVYSKFSSEFVSPGLVKAVISAHRMNADFTPGEELGTLIFPHALTPETATSTFLFMAETRNFSIHDTSIEPALLESNMRILHEDMEALELIESHTSAEIEYITSVRADAGALRVKKVIDEMIAAESAANAG